MTCATFRDHYLIVGERTHRIILSGPPVMDRTQPVATLGLKAMEAIGTLQG